HDAIYAGQVEDLRLNANKLDVNQLREDTMHKAVSGTLRGKQKLKMTKFDSEVYQTSNDNLGYVYIDINGWERPSSIYEKLHGWNITKNKAASLYKSPTAPHVFNVTHDDGSQISVQDKIMISYYRTDFNAQFDSLPWVDIIGKPENIAATFPDGVVGQWIPHIIDNTQIQNVALNRKSSVSVGNQVFTHDNGQTWTSNTFTIDAVKNARTLAANEQNIVIIKHYESMSNFSESSQNLVVLGDIKNVYASQAYLNEYGNRLQSSLVGKVGKRNSSAYFQEFLSVSKHTFFSPNQTLGWTSREGDEPKHTGVSLDAPNDRSPGFKALYSCAKRNGLLYLQFHG
ncbi:hypothetical protein, partial [Pseudoalteromonas sp. S16_S37]|uniref:hypothetical protein n=1 Tax=Pseudoalteromonas sp. S16_S37 TaxID=2720228 RepID=UPI001681468A